MKNTVLLLLAILPLFSCLKKEVASTSPLKIGKGENSLERVRLYRSSDLNIVMQGGNGKYKAFVEDAGVAKVSVSLDTLKIIGLKEGTTSATVSSHDQKVILDISVVHPPLFFDRSELKLHPSRLEKRSIVTLYGGDERTTLTKEDPDDVLNVQWNGRDGVVTIVAHFEGDAVLVARSSDGEESRLKVVVRAEDFPEKIGVYATNSRFCNNMQLDPIYVSFRKEQGVILSNLANPRGGKFVPMDPQSRKGSSILIEPIVNPVEGEKKMVKVKHLAGVPLEEIKEGDYECIVDRVTPQGVQLRCKYHKFFIPYEKK